MENATNTINEGLVTDLHPLSIKNTQMTDALNATVLTFNGNEAILQNDMGNTKIEDSTTGHIMSLRDGFIPVGMKEHGGILYIASYNPTTNQGELGTIPSPLFNYTYNTIPYQYNCYGNPLIFTDLSTTTNTLLDTSKYSSVPLQISDKRFQVGEQFIVILDIDDTQVLPRKIISKNVTSIVPGVIADPLKQNGLNTPDLLSDTQFITLINNNKLNISALFNFTIIKSGSIVTKNYNLITGFQENNNIIGDSDTSDFGLFKINLEAKTERSDNTITCNYVQKARQKYYLNNSFEPQLSKYWFIPKKDCTINTNEFNLDTDLCQADNQYRTYPNILPGYLYVSATPELPENFQFLKNISTGINSPSVYIIYDINEE